MLTYELNISLVVNNDGVEEVEKYAEEGEGAISGISITENLEMFVGPRIDAAKHVIIKKLKTKYSKEN